MVRYVAVNYRTMRKCLLASISYRSFFIFSKKLQGEGIMTLKTNIKTRRKTMKKRIPYVFLFPGIQIVDFLSDDAFAICVATHFPDGFSLSAYTAFFQDEYYIEILIRTNSVLHLLQHLSVFCLVFHSVFSISCWSATFFFFISDSSFLTCSTCTTKKCPSKRPS